MLSRFLAAVATAAAVLTTAVTPASATILTGSHQIVNGSWRDMCLDVKGAGVNNGDPVGVSTCANASHQLWTRTILPDNSSQLTAAHSTKCLSARVNADGTVSRGATVVQDRCDPAVANQRWTITDDPNGWSLLAMSDTAGTLWCVDKAGWTAVMWDCDFGKSWQRWQSLG